jgi:hypothetical protein
VLPELGDGGGVTMESWWALPQYAMAASTMLARGQAVRASVTERDFKISVEGPHTQKELRDWWRHVKPAVPPAGG